MRVVWSWARVLKVPSDRTGGRAVGGMFWHPGAVLDQKLLDPLVRERRPPSWPQSTWLTDQCEASQKPAHHTSPAQDTYKAWQPGPNLRGGFLLLYLEVRQEHLGQPELGREGKRGQCWNIQKVAIPHTCPSQQAQLTVPDSGEPSTDDPSWRSGGAGSNSFSNMGCSTCADAAFSQNVPP